jgi:hypothetical protein
VGFSFLPISCCRFRSGISSFILFLVDSSHDPCIQKSTWSFTLAHLLLTGGPSPSILQGCSHPSLGWKMSYLSFLCLGVFICQVETRITSSKGYLEKDVGGKPCSQLPPGITDQWNLATQRFVILTYSHRIQDAPKGKLNPHRRSKLSRLYLQLQPHPLAGRLNSTDQVQPPLLLGTGWELLHASQVLHFPPGWALTFYMTLVHSPFSPPAASPAL